MAICTSCEINLRQKKKLCSQCGRPFVLQADKTTYFLEEVLGEGGFGIVYRARDVDGLLWAIKENITENLSKPEDIQASREQFEREALVLSLLTHPNLTPVVDYFVYPPGPKGRQYLVMEYVEGQDLAEWLDQYGVASEAQAIQWMKQIMDAVNYLHTRPRPLTHRDIKPANIRLLPDGQMVKLVDFGIIKIGGGPTVRAALGATEGYSPPEQYGGRGGTGPPSDVYALGATLYTILTARIPPHAIDRAHSGATVERVRKLNPNVSANTERIIHKAMALDAGHRYKTAGEMLHTWTGTSPPPPPPPDPLPPMPKGAQPPKSPQALRIRKHISGGIYQNILQWEPSPTPNTQYIVVRKYDSVPISEHDGIRLAVVSGTIYKDQNPDIGKSACYAVYAVQMYANQVELISSQAACTKTFRVADVISPTARRISSMKVELAWKSPPNVHEIRVKRSTMGPARGPNDVNADDVELMKSPQSGIVDRQAPVNIPLTYTIYCRFVDMLDDYGIKTSPGISIDVK